jgi:peptide/nickel transport system ATP-binding protein
MTTIIGREIATIAGEPTDPYSVSPGCAFAPRCPRAQSVCLTDNPTLEVGPSGAHVACHFPLGPSTRVVRPPEISSAPAAPLAVDSEGSNDRHVILSCTNVGVRFGKRTALASVDLSVAEGESVAIVGESGSGKSTLLRVIAGLQRATTGTVELRGGRPQMVFQDAGSSLTPWLSVGELVGEQLPRGLTRAERARRVLEALDRVGLPASVARVRASALSGGQRQRVALARVTIVPPPLLLCDEPTSALDPSLAAVAVNMLKELQEELRMALVFVTHDLAAARFVGDRIVVMSGGSVVETGSALDVTTNPTDPRTRALLASVPSVHSRRPRAVGEAFA